MEIIVNSLQELEELEIEYNLEDCGMSGCHVGMHWLCDSESDVNVYYSNNIFENVA